MRAALFTIRLFCLLPLAFRLLLFRFAFVLAEFAVEGLAPDAERARGARLVAAGVVERGLNRTALDLVYGGGHFDFERDCAALGCRALALAARSRALLSDGAAYLFGQVVEFYLAARRDDDCALNRVLKLAHVAGPVVLVKRLQGRARDAGDEAPGLLLVVFEEVYDERVYVAGPLAQRRKPDWEDRETVEEVESESPLLDRLRQVNVRGGDDPNIGLQNFATADARELAVLKNAQQTHLRGETHLAYLVEE